MRPRIQRTTLITTRRRKRANRLKQAGRVLRFPPMLRRGFPWITEDWVGFGHQDGAGAQSKGAHPAPRDDPSGVRCAPGLPSECLHAHHQPIPRHRDRDVLRRPWASPFSTHVTRMARQRSESTISRSSTARSAGGSYDLCWGGRNCISQSCRKTGAERELVRHLGRSSHCDERPYA